MSSPRNRSAAPSGSTRDADNSIFGQALGATSVLDVPEESLANPSSLALLARHAAERLRSSGGRPTDPDWTLVRQVPFTEENWGRLGILADEISAHGRRVAPAQLAAMLVEDGLDRLRPDGSDDPDDTRRAATAAELDRHLERGSGAPKSTGDRSRNGGPG